MSIFWLIFSVNWLLKYSRNFIWFSLIVFLLIPSFFHCFLFPLLCCYEFWEGEKRQWGDGRRREGVYEDERKKEEKCWKIEIQSIRKVLNTNLFSLLFCLSINRRWSLLLLLLLLLPLLLLLLLLPSSSSSLYLASMIYL